MSYHHLGILSLLMKQGFWFGASGTLLTLKEGTLLVLFGIHTPHR